MKKLLLLLITGLLINCADVPDTEMDGAPELEKSEQAVVVAGFPIAIKVAPLVTANPTGQGWSGTTMTLYPNGGVIWGTQGYLAPTNNPAGRFIVGTNVNATSCTVDPTGGYFCAGRSVKCPTVKPSAVPASYSMASAPSAFFSWAGDAVDSWWTAASGFNQTFSSFNQTVTGPSTIRIECAYPVGNQSYALGHY